MRRCGGAELLDTTSRNTETCCQPVSSAICILRWHLLTSIYEKDVVLQAWLHMNAFFSTSASIPSPPNLCRSLARIVVFMDSSLPHNHPGSQPYNQSSPFIAQQQTASASSGAWDGGTRVSRASQIGNFQASSPFPPQHGRRVDTRSVQRTGEAVVRDAVSRQEEAGGGMTFPLILTRDAARGPAIRTAAATSMDLDGFSATSRIPTRHHSQLDMAAAASSCSSRLAPQQAGPTAATTAVVGEASTSAQVADNLAPPVAVASVASYGGRFDASNPEGNGFEIRMLLPHEGEGEGEGEEEERGSRGAWGEKL